MRVGAPEDISGALSPSKSEVDATTVMRVIKPPKDGLYIATCKQATIVAAAAVGHLNVIGKHVFGPVRLIRSPASRQLFDDQGY